MLRTIHALLLLMPAVASSGWLPEERLTVRPDTADFTAQNNARAVAADNQGNIHVVWYGKSGAQSQIWYTRRDAVTGQWSRDTTLTSEPLGAYNPAVASDDSGNLHVVWQTASASAGTALRYRQRMFAGLWQPTETVDSGTGLSSPSIAARQPSFVTIVWQKQFTPGMYKHILAAIRRDSGWGQPESVSGSGLYNDYRPSVGVSAAGVLAVAWQTDAGEDAILFRERGNTGWSPAETVQLSYNCRAPCLDVARNGTAHVIWLLQPPGGDREHLVYRQRKGGIWLDTSAVFAPTLLVTPGSVCSDARGCLHVAWCKSDRLFYATADSTGIVWSPACTLVATTTKKENPSICAGPGTDVQVVWTDYRHHSTNPDVYFRKNGLLRDIAVNRIERPVGNVDSGVAVTPVVWVSNQGESAEFDVRVRLRLDSIEDEQVIPAIQSGDSCRVSFNLFTPECRGWNPAVCSTALPGDVNRANDVVRDSFFVRVRDVSVDSIRRPTGRLPAGTFFPCALVQNRGNVGGQVTARFSITARESLCYSDSLTRILQAGRLDSVVFVPWLGRPGVYAATCSTVYAGDMHPENNVRSQSFELYWWDVGVEGITWPPVQIDSGMSGQPAVVFRNCGSRREAFSAFLAIGTDYADSLDVASLEPYQDTTLLFNTWLALRRGSLPVSCSLYCLGDMNPANNAGRCSVLVQVRDVALESIVRPVGSLPLDTVRPMALVRNLGNLTVTCTAHFSIVGDTGLVYSDTEAMSLVPDTMVAVEFQVWPGWCGKFSARCSVAYDHDMHPENNVRSQQFDFYRRDIGVTGVQWPSVKTDSGASGRPTASVRNHGTRSEGFKAFFTIGPGYADSVSVESLEPGQETALWFKVWEPVARNWQHAACSVACPGDMDPQNDVLLCSTFVLVRDVAAESILSPVGTIRTDTVTPRVRVSNPGNSPARVRSYFRIASDSGGMRYLDSLEARLAPGVTEEISFALWHGSAGRFRASCSVVSLGDMRPENNIVESQFVGYRPDVRVIEMIWPVAVVDSGSRAVPHVKIGNFGQLPVSAVCSLYIGPYYGSADTAENLAPTEIRDLMFKPEYVAIQRGWQAVLCSIMSIEEKTKRPGERLPNARMTDNLPCSIFVRVIDAGAEAIIRPRGTIGTGEVCPTVQLANFGNVAADVPCWIRIEKDGNTVYRDSTTIAILPESEARVEFAPWYATNGAYSATGWTALDSDARRANDTVSAAFQVCRVDASLKSILEPVGTVRPGSIVPRVVVANLGDVSSNIACLLSISDSSMVHKDSVSLAAVPPGAETVVTFRPWNAVVGHYSVSARTRLTGDENPANDTVSAEVLVESLFVRRWTRLADLPRCSDNRPVRDGAGLAPFNRGLLALKGGGSDECWRYDLDGDSWIAAASVPPGLSGRRLKSGAAICSDGATRAFVLRGNRTREFLCYDAPGDSWVFLPSLPAQTKLLKHGAGLAYVARDTVSVFFVKGSGTRDFLVYWVGQRQWHARRQLPAGPRGRPARRGTSLAALGTRIFCLKGGTGEFYEYFVRPDSWTRRADLPATVTGTIIRDGAALCSDQNRYIYAFKGRSDEFWRYDPTQDGWERLDDIPRGVGGRKTGRGAALAVAQGRIYALKGNSASEVWRFDPQAAFWSDPSEHVLDKGHGVSGQSPNPEPRTMTSELPFVYDAAGRRAQAFPTSARAGVIRAPGMRPGVYFVLSGKGITRVLVVR